MILINITSNESPQSVFKKQVNARALEDWSNGVGLFVRNFNWAKYYIQLGRDYMQYRKEVLKRI